MSEHGDPGHEQRQSTQDVWVNSNSSPPWSRTTKTIVIVVGLLLLAGLAWRFQSLIGQIVTAAVLAYVLGPIVRVIDEKTPLARGTTIVVIYLVFILLIIGAFTALGFAAYRQVNNLILQLPDLITDLVGLVRGWLPDPDANFAIGPVEFTLSRLDWPSIQEQLLNLLEPTIGRGGQFAGQLAGTTLRTVGNFLFIWVISIYVAIEIPRFGGYVQRVAQQPGYQRDARRLMEEFGNIWSAYLRGQIILGVVIGTTVGVTLAILGVQNALALGILSGLLEFVPVIGPVIGTAAALLVAFFQPENYLGLTQVEFGLAVLAVMFLIQQLENNILVPRIVGRALDLHPLLVIIGVFMGGSVAGILGAIMAAPILATVKLLGLYAWRKLFDVPPFPEPEQEEGPSSLTVWERLRMLLARQRRGKDASPPDTPSTSPGRDIP